MCRSLSKELVTMNKQGILLAIAFMLLFTSIALATSSASSNVVIYAFDQNPAGSDEGNEWVTFHNSTAIDWIAEGTILYPGAYYTYTPHYRWLDNSEEAIILRNAKGEEVDRTPVLSDNENDNRYWMRNNSEWTFGVMELKKGELWSGYVKNVVDGDTVDVCFNIYGIQRVRLVGINTPEIGEAGYEEAKDFVNTTCWGEAITLDVDDMEQYDSYYRILAVVYVNGTNLNEKLVREGYAEVMYIPPSEFDSREWEADYTPSPSSMPTTTQTPGFELLFAIIGVVVAIYLIRRER
jgi:micrococcal nuclease